MRDGTPSYRQVTQQGDRRCTGNPSAPTQQRDAQGIPQLPPWWMMWNPNSSRAQEQHQSMAEMRPRSPCKKSSRTSDRPAGSVSAPPAPRPVKPVDSSHPSGVHQIFSTSWTPCSPPHSPSCALPSQLWLAGVTGAPGTGISGEPITLSKEMAI